MANNNSSESDIKPSLPDHEKKSDRNDRKNFLNLKTKAIVLAIAASGISGLTFIGSTFYAVNKLQSKLIPVEVGKEQDARQLQTQLSDLRSQLLFTTVLGSLGIGIIASILASRLIEAQIMSLLTIDKTLDKLIQGDLTVKVELEKNSEFQELGSSINRAIDKFKLLQKEQILASQEQIEAQTAIAKKERQVNESIQQELLQFLMNIEGASNGDLTVRAEITDGQIGIVADFFNSILENWRDIVTQVQNTTIQVNASVGENENAIRKVAEETSQQTTQIGQTLSAVEIMTDSIQEVAKNAQTAAEVSRTAALTAETGGETIEETVTSILQLRETVASTAKKVKRLGESSQEISKVISLIEQIAMQTNLLAINASIEASRAGEEGRGFAVVAEEVGELAAKSAEATQEIEEIIENIQEETQEVVEAMEIGTAQVVEGTRLVENTKQNLDRIVSVSHQIDRLLQSISNATISQAQTSQTVTKLMQEVSQVSSRTSDASSRVSNSLEETVKIARDLEASIGTFKV